MNIIIVTGSPFPEGMAPTNRIISYGKGFIANNAKVKVISLYPYKYSVRNKDLMISKGNFDNIKYERTVLFNEKNKLLKYKLLKFLQLYGLYKGLYIIIKENKKEKIDTLILHSNVLLYIFSFKFITKILKIKYIQEKSEFPFVLKKRTFLGKIYAKFYVNTVYKLFDGILVESQRLYDFFITKIKKNSKLLIVPPTIDPNSIVDEPINPFNDEYIFYCGSLSKDKKDGVDILIYAFNKILNKFPKIKLFIAGAGDLNYINFLKDIINNLNINKNVQIIGELKKNELIKYLKNAKILALAKENDYLQSGGFSSKVIEYLYTGNPVVLTDLGITTSYLKDKETAFFAEPNNIDSFANVLIFVLENYDFAVKVGKSGQQFALKYFDYITHTKRIINFIDSL